VRSIWSIPVFVVAVNVLEVNACVITSVVRKLG